MFCFLRTWSSLHISFFFFNFSSTFYTIVPGTLFIYLIPPQFTKSTGTGDWGAKGVGRVKTNTLLLNKQAEEDDCIIKKKEA